MRLFPGRIFYVNKEHMISTFLIIFVTLNLLLPLPGEALEPVIMSSDGSEMILIPEGEFIMGLASDEPGGDKIPQNKVFLKSFYIDKYEITNDKYHVCVSAGKCKDPSWLTDYPGTLHEDGKKWYRDKKMGNYPVVGLTWHQAVIYCRWAGKRLPLSSEWEKAARGTDGGRYPWGNEWSGKRANHDDRGKIDGYEKIAPIGSFPQGSSPYGVMDMSGNVRELVDNLVLKGGSWYSLPISLRSGDPGHGYPVERDDDMGFRCAMDVNQNY
jgi:formylglycine-generating enzyme required for sulfatase activity